MLAALDDLQPPLHNARLSGGTSGLDDFELPSLDALLEAYPNLADLPPPEDVTASDESGTSQVPIRAGATFMELLPKLSAHKGQTLCTKGDVGMASGLQAAAELPRAVQIDSRPCAIPGHREAAQPASSGDSTHSAGQRLQGASARCPSPCCAHPLPTPPAPEHSPGRTGDLDGEAARASSGTPSGTEESQRGAQKRQRDSQSGADSGEEASASGMPDSEDTDEAKRAVRMQRNRESAQQSRARKKMQLDELEGRCTHLQTQNTQLTGGWPLSAREQTLAAEASFF